MSYYRPLDIKALGNVPRSIGDLRMWLLWKEGKEEGGGQKPKKLPHYANHKPRSGTLDSVVDRGKLVTLADAVRAYRSRHRSYAGVGIALGAVPGTDVVLAGIDLDHCVDENGNVAPGAKKVLAAVPDAYAEISPSGTGIKIFGTGTFETVATPDYEIYSGGRFFTVTGDRINE